MTLQLGLPLHVRVKAAQTFLTSTIRYTLALTPVPKHMEDLINITIQNYVLGKKRSFLNRKILELDYQYGGIRLPNIINIRKSYDLKMIRDIASQKKPWHPILMKIIEHDYDHKIQGIDILKYTEHHPKRSLPKYIFQVLKTFKDFGGTCTEPTTSLRLQARSAGNFINSKRFEPIYPTLDKLAKPRELQQPHSLAIDTPNKLREILGGKLPKNIYQNLINKLPVTVTPKVLQSHGKTSVWLITDTDGTTYEADRYTVHNNTVHWEEPKSPIVATTNEISLLDEVSISPTGHKLRHFPNLTTIDDYSMDLNNQAFTLRDFTIKRANEALQSAETHYHSDIWDRLDPQPDWPKLPCKKLHPTLPPKLYDLRYKCMHDRIYIGKKAKHLPTVTIANPDICPWCNQADSIEHLFLDCPTTQSLWNTVSNFLQTACSTIDALFDETTIVVGPPDPPKGLVETMTNLAVSTMQHQIWTSRNQYLYENIPPRPEEITARWRHTLKANLTICKNQLLQPNYNPKLWGFHREDATALDEAISLL